MQRRGWELPLLLGLLGVHCAFFHREATAYESAPVALVLPVESMSQLEVRKEGLALLNSIRGPVSPVVVIGPYRSGKSFTLNQLLGVPCNQGFGVGHTRETETKGIWLWGTPVEKKEADGSSSMVLYVDTEGFESTGKANSYDDRIFALSALLSSLLIYNLPETIRESDVAKLSFAVDLAQGFYERDGDKAMDDGILAPAPGSIEPGSMLWLIQRDFLQGVTAGELVAQVLAPVPNPHRDPGLEALNQIRSSLSHLARNSTGFSLRQPHLDRTKLCEMTDEQLDPAYVQQREQLKDLVRTLARPKVLNGKPMSGPALAGLVSRMVAALNEQEIPTATSLVAAFNRDLLSRCVANYTAAMGALVLPVEEEQLEREDITAKAIAVEMLKSMQLGRQKGVDVKADLVRDLERAYQVRRTENLAASNELCSQLENTCEELLDAMQAMSVPSLRKFEAAYERCQHTFETKCRGPSKGPNTERLAKAWQRARREFQKGYNDRLYMGLLIVSLAVVVVFRFIIKFQLAEAAGWVSFVVLEVYPKLHPGSSLYDTSAWAVTVRLWEGAVAVFLGFPGSGTLWLIGLVAAVVLRVVYRRRGLSLIHI